MYTYSHARAAPSPPRLLLYAWTSPRALSVKPTEGERRQEGTTIRITDDNPVSKVHIWVYANMPVSDLEKRLGLIVSRFTWRRH